ncbi:MAG: hypothetical protein V2B18_25410 [Pseudomonadota bacterium]
MCTGDRNERPAEMLCLKADYERMKAERDEAADAFLHIKEAIGEMSFGVDLPSCFILSDMTGRINSIPGSYAKPFYNAIYRKLEVTPPSHWLRDCRESQGKLRIDRDRLQEQIRTWILDIMERREYDQCWYRSNDDHGDCGNWFTCNPHCVLRKMMDCAGIKPQEDGGLDKQVLAGPAEGER